MEIPAGVRALMWEFSIDDQSIDESFARTVVERTMERGGWNEMKWLLRRFDGPHLRSFLEERGRKVLPPRELRFWSHICGIPGSTQDEWVSDARLRSAAWRG